VEISLKNALKIIISLTFKLAFFLNKNIEYSCLLIFKQFIFLTIDEHGEIAVYYYYCILCIAVTPTLVVKLIL